MTDRKMFEEWWGGDSDHAAPLNRDEAWDLYQYAIATERARVGWQPIELAPKDRPILLLRPTAFEWGRVTMGQWSDDKYGKKPKPFWSGELWGVGITHSREWTPAMWMEIPEGPQDD